jgi:antitoxin component of MazEF toxin-antitoxin module
MVDSFLDSGKLAIVPLGRRRPTLASLLAGITKRNRHGMTDTGAHAGREVW